ncbi:MAG: hypothetical protein AB7F99_07780 [Vicinamibacterales bacterium]
MQVPLPWERLLWSQRAWWPSRGRYLLTDFRLVVQSDRTIDEIALDDIRDVQHTRTAAGRLIGRSTLVVRSRNPRQPELRLRHVRRGSQLAALLDLLATEGAGRMDGSSVQAALAWSPGRTERRRRGAIAATGALAASLLITVAIGMRGEAAAVSYPPNDAIYPGGVKRDRAAIMRFMEAKVLPWARTTLGPLKGGADRVTCATCHGSDADSRQWQMPSVAALPEPHVRPIGVSADDVSVDAQMRNAIYGYLAESENHARAKYMREVVLPGMARLLRRPAYDFTRTYEYNRTRFAIGCYHCHKVTDQGLEPPRVAPS